MTRAIALALIALNGLFAEELPQHVLNLARVKARVQENLRTVPDYTCLAVTDRFEQGFRDAAPRQVDVVRMEVAHSGGTDLYAWPGATSFEASSAAELIGAGMYGSGEFATHLGNLFGGFAVIKYAGEADVLGRKLWRWNYSLAEAFNKWAVTFGSRTANAGEIGSFWVDERTFDIARLEVHSDGLPPNFPISQVDTMIDYARVRIGAREVLLPQSALTITTEGFSGKRSQNYTEFSHCRQYVTQSEVKYNVQEPPVAEGASSSGVKETTIPANLRVAIALTTEVNSQTAAVGDLIEAVVTSEVTQKNRTIVPKGAVLRGRLRRMDLRAGPPDQFVVGLEFMDLESPGHHARFLGRLERVDTQVPGFHSLMDFMHVKQKPTAWGVEVVTSGTAYRIPAIPGVGVFFIEGSSFRLPKGMAMTWVTEEVARK